MTRFRAALLLCALLPAAARAQPADAEHWVSYRDAYRAMLPFEKFGRPKNLLQLHYQVIPRQPQASLDGLRLTLNGKSGPLNLPLDALGRAVFPLLKSAYDDNATLTLNRNIEWYKLQPRVAIAARPDGSYEAAELRAACDQALDFERYLNPAARAWKCAGVRFVFDRKAAAEVRFRKPDGAAQALPASMGAAFQDGAGDSYRLAGYRFGDWPDKGQIVSPAAPLAIAPLFE